MIENIYIFPIGPLAPMDPETEDLIRGVDLKNGMFVIIERGYATRAPLDGATTPYEIEKIQIDNRWCEVTNVSFTRRRNDNPLVSFIGVYADGSKVTRTYDAIHYGWVVKKESIPVERPAEPKKLTRDAILKKLAEVISQYEEGFEDSFTTAFHETRASKILDIYDIMYRRPGL